MAYQFRVTEPGQEPRWVFLAGAGGIIGDELSHVANSRIPKIKRDLLGRAEGIAAAGRLVEMLRRPESYYDKHPAEYDDWSPLSYRTTVDKIRYVDITVKGWRESVGYTV